MIPDAWKPVRVGLEPSWSTRSDVMEDIFISTVGVCDGVYVKISIFHLDINCLVDTGSSQTIISRTTFNRISPRDRRRLVIIDVSLLSLKLVDGSPLACSADIIVPVRINNVVCGETSCTGCQHF